jgi:hypothetical protein
LGGESGYESGGVGRFWGSHAGDSAVVVVEEGGVADERGGREFEGPVDVEDGDEVGVDGVTGAADP